MSQHSQSGRTHVKVTCRTSKFHFSDKSLDHAAPFPWCRPKALWNPSNRVVTVYYVYGHGKMMTPQSLDVPVAGDEIHETRSCASPVLCWWGVGVLESSKWPLRHASTRRRLAEYRRPFSHQEQFTSGNLLICSPAGAFVLDLCTSLSAQVNGIMYFSPAFIAAAAVFLLPVANADIDRPSFTVRPPTWSSQLPLSFC